MDEHQRIFQELSRDLKAKGKSERHDTEECSRALSVIRDSIDDASSGIENGGADFDSSDKAPGIRIFKDHKDDQLRFSCRGGEVDVVIRVGGKEVTETVAASNVTKGLVVGYINRFFRKAFNLASGS